ncbi:ABC transporter substrate-binding protein [Cohnella candidum]|uniref:Extracellular solute-binding protein n=1 Tax=Cohnella candidum TaxID=2674991 RepID=A0A3G3JYU6_9BACL|nr:extracellular solute-binding protein [Cohnella candidum]AYQ73027.1 extracellular solute-binding protein [Cohnella candidum]
MRRAVCALLSLVLFAIVIGGCGGRPEEAKKAAPDVSLNLWGWIDSGSLEERVVQEAVADFNRSNPFHAQIDYQTFNDDFKIKIATEAAANNLPDLFFSWEEGFLAPFVRSGMVLPLDDMIDQTRFIPGILDHVSFDGHVYAMPLVRTAEVVYYNRALFEKYHITVPSTTDELIAAVRTLRAAGVTPIALGNKDVWPGGLLLGTLVYRHGGGAVFRKAADGDVPFTAKPFIDAAADFKRLVDAGAFGRNTNSADMDTARRQFMEGKAAMWVMGSWELDDLNADQLPDGKPNPLHGHVGFFNWPEVSDGAAGREAWIVSPDFNIAVSRNVRSKEAAAYFLKLISSPKYQGEMVRISHLPATVLREASKSTDSPLVSELMRQLGSAKDTITFPDRIMGQTTIGGAMNASVQELLIGRDPKETMKRLEERASEYRSESAGR